MYGKAKLLKEFQNQQIPTVQLKSIVGGDGSIEKIELATEKIETVM